MKGKKIGLALGGGAARGLSHIGVIKALEKNGIEISFIAGSSVGAMIGGAYAVTGDIRKIEEIVIQTNWKKIASLVDLTFPLRGLIDGSKLEEFIKVSIGDAKFSDTKIPFAAVATDISNGDRVILNEGSVAKAARASISIPILFKPFKYGDKFLVDGEVVDPIPVKLAREMGADFVIAVNLFSDLKRFYSKESTKEISPASPFGSKIDEALFGRLDRYLKTPNAIKTGIHAIAIMTRHLAIPQLKEADLVITPDVLDIGSYQFTKAKELIKRGEEAVEEMGDRLGLG